MNSKKNLKRNLLICLLAGSAVMYTLPLHAATSVIGNTTLPGNILQQIGGVKPDRDNVNHVLDVTQSNPNAFIKWDSFDVGGSATVNFDYTGQTNFNTLNYVNSGAASQIYGTINAQHGTYNGNIFIVNPAGVQIGNSAQINVGSLYVSNQNLDTVDWSSISANTDVNTFLNHYDTHTNAELMSLGNINATEVTFEGDGRIVIDSERLKDVAGTEKLTADKIFVNTKDKNNVVIGYDAYENGSYAKVDNTQLVTLNGSEKLTKADGYMWVEDVEQLQAINTNLGGNYALRNSIDATSTATDTFISIGDHNKEFTGKFDGLDYSIFELNIDSFGKDYAGLFGVTDGAVINNVTIVGGNISGGSSVGAVVGYAKDTTISNVINSASVTGDAEVGGIVGTATGSTITNAVNTGTVHSNGESDGRGGTVSNAGGLIGYMYNGTLDGNSYNLGDVSGDGYNVGGLVGHAVNSVIGNEGENAQLVYNRMDVTGAYNVGGIVGNMEGSTVQNAENSGTVLAEEFTTEGYIYHTANSKFDNAYGNAGDGIGGVKVNVANVGGIAGKADNTVDNESKIENVTNSGDVSSNTGKYEQFNEEHDYYTAGNVGGIVGRAENTDITNATNKENDIRGAHNVGGVAGYFGGKGNVTTGVNNGGDILATGARAAAGVTSDVVNDAGFALEHVRTSNTGDEDFIIGNMGGIVGYLDGDDVYVTGSANRGTVHSQNIDNTDEILYTSQAANTGGVVGKINRNKINDEDGNILNNEAILAGIKDGSITAAVTDSYNTGDVRGYSGVGGVIGMMYNGEVAGSYNQGDINTTRQPKGGDRTTVNMGGVVGDTTEESNASAVLYNVYNSGQIGDETYTNYARHVGGVVGRLSGTVDKAYNTGAIYNGYSVVGGIAGWFYEGTISNAFNTGNITVNNKETGNAGSQVGGIAGGISGYSRGTNRIYNAYNLGTLRSFSETTSNPNQVGGIVGQIVIGNGAQTSVEIKNVYTTSNIYSATGSGAGIIYGKNGIDQNLTIEGANYIDLDSTNFTDISGTNKNNEYSGSAINKVAYDDRYKSDAYNFVNLNTGEKIWANVDGTTVSDDGYWRIYNNGKTGTTPILNAFLPDSENYFAQNGLQDATGTFEGSVQYGTAYDPLLTIIKNNSNRDLSFEIGTGEKQLSISNAAGIAVYGSGLTLKGFTTNNGTGYFGGIIYSEGALTIKAAEKEDVGFGKGTKIYGSSVTLNADGTITVYGDITATGESGDSDINITSGENVDIYGTLTSVAVGEETNILGILDSSLKDVDFGNISDKDSAVTNIGNRFTHTSESKATGNINIVAGKTDEDGKVISGGNANLYFGNQEDGLITTGGDLNVEATGDVYVDSDLDIGGDLTLTGNGANSEVVLDLTNIGQVQAKNGTVDDAVTGLHNFMHHFSDTAGGGAQAGNKTISLNSASGDSKITVDMWDYENDKFYLGKYDETTAGGHTFRDELNNLNLKVDKTVVANDNVKDHIYIWVNNGEQLKNIQTAANSNNDVLGYNFALKGDINASDVTDYEAIGGTTGFTGTFDGRGNRIIGLDTIKDENSGNTNSMTNAGIFSTIGEGGTVKNVNIYSGNFEGTNTAGAVAGVNNGRIEGIVTFGNTVTVTGGGGNAGGIVGTNSGTVDDVESSGSVIAERDNAIVGGLVGTNESAATVNNSYSNSAVTSTSGTDAGLGGVVGVNEGTVSLVDSLGVTNGTNSTNVGGVIGINSGTLSSAYNESIVNGNSNVGGIIGTNGTYTVNGDTIIWNRRGTVSNIVNATSVTGKDKNNASEYVGGLVGINGGIVENGRNNGTITGIKFVGGMVGSNAQGATLTNITNDSSAAIEGEQYVGGIAGSNAGKISATDDTLINRGSITGNKFVGGVAGVNEDGGTIENTISNIELNVKTPYTDDGNSVNDPAFFGGVVGQNSGTIIGATNQSSVDVAADGATYVGGIIGQNTSTGTLEGKIHNGGTVSGLSNVGGIIGENQNAQILNNADGQTRLQITNTGNVSAETGGAAGIFYNNNITGGEDETNANAINNVDIINSGTVTGGTDAYSITGGLFGINSGNITNSTLTNTGVVTGGGTVGGLIGTNSGSASGSVFTNDGIVEGEDKVGGLFGINSGSFNTSSLINTVNAQVTGKREVGGLIGVNSGNIEGGRLEANGTNGYYKYQIYNNGTINVTEEGTYIGGLFGTNSGEVKAAYNTGVINAGQSSNVGGIAGVNEQGGKLDQVFNTVMTGVDDEGNTVYGTITGKDNVGGLVGTNSGTLSNAYNTTDVSGTTNVGNAVGRNEANATVNNVYDVNNTGNRLIAENNGNVTGSYSGNEADKKTTGITYVAEGDKLKEDSYKDSLNDADTWKFYDGNSNPLLKVFLTDVEIKVDVDEINEYINNVYNGNAQAITDEDIDKLIAAGAITAPDNFEAYNNAKELINSISHTNAGEYSDWLYSQQIASNGNGEIFNPNNLGYNIALTADIDTAKLTINLGEVTHIYGAPNTNGYNYTVEGWINPDDANDYTITIGTLGNGITDNALKDNNIHTNDVDEYTWSTTTASISANGSLNNYEIVTVKDGTSKVIPVTINVILNDVTHIYGDSFNSNDYTVGNVDWVNGDNYTTADVVLSNINDGAFTNGNGGKTNDVTADGYKWNATVSGNGANAESINKNYIFNVIDGDSKVTPKEVTIEDILASIEYGSKGDFTVENTGNINGTVYDDNLGISYTDTSVIAGSEYALNQNGRDTADVKVNNGVYTDSISINGIKLTGDKAGNYYISSDTAKGDIRVDKAQIHIGANNEAIHVGEKPDYIGTDINGALVNGDKLNGNYHYGVENSADEKVVGDHSIGVWIGNTFYDLSATVDWTKVDGFFANYNVTFVPGTLTVTEQVMPDLPDNWPNNRWDYLFGDNPFDRNENFRERKAEVNFVDGAMEI